MSRLYNPLRSASPLQREEALYTYICIFRLRYQTATAATAATASYYTAAPLFKRKRNLNMTQTPPTATTATYFINFSYERETIEILYKKGGGERQRRHLVIIRYIGRRHPKTAAPLGKNSICRAAPLKNSGATW